MELKITLTGWFIYAALLLYLAAWVALLSGFKKTGRVLFSAGFFAALVAVACRGYAVSHFPMQSIFEVFLFMGMLVYPVSLLCRRTMLNTSETIDPLLGALLLIPAGFVFSATPQKLPPALQHWLFGPHVAVYLAGYLFMFKAGAVAIKLLILPGGNPDSTQRNQEVWNLLRLGFPLLTLGLILGAWWGKIAWGNYWNWDPKEMWALAMWLVYAGYFHVYTATRGKLIRLNSAIALLGCLIILCTLLWANFSRLFAGLHTYAY
ncbi:MAG: cytochrome c biogenesis protein CcsA [Candidatus Omnitrophica bacterium]|nr:cytochrome c biogenesis protein CcsA [Candidatus Omnitrophota bacterium]